MFNSWQNQVVSEEKAKKQPLATLKSGVSSVELLFT